MNNNNITDKDLIDMIAEIARLRNYIKHLNRIVIGLKIENQILTKNNKEEESEG